MQYIFTNVDQFIKYGWIIPLDNKKAEMILRAFKNVMPHIIFLIKLQVDKGR